MKSLHQFYLNKPENVTLVEEIYCVHENWKCYFSWRNLLCQWKLNWHTLGVWSITPNALNVSYSSFSSTSGSKLPINMLAPTSKFLWFADAWKHVNVCSGLWTKYWLSIYYCIKANLILKHHFWPIICY